MAQSRNREDALAYHAEGRPGKIEVVPTKPHSTQRDLTLAYSPGVAEPCLEIAANPGDVYKYTAKGNLVAVISNGTAVLGLGNIGALAGKPVMEGKGMLFKIYAGIDVFDIEVETQDIDAFVETVRNIAPTFGGINLEDIKAPECFEIERRLKEVLTIPIMHDDQHGTAIISSAALLNACELTGRSLADARIVINGAGAAAISCARLYMAVGARREHILMLDSKGVIHTGRTDLDANKQFFAIDTPLRSLEDAMKGADVFVGLSKGNVVTAAMVQSMNARPVVFALANPTPEISYDEAKAARPDVIMATGRSDNPNQVNNVLGFPYIFRGALDVRASGINEEMKLAATYALARLAKEPVPDAVNMAYASKNLHFGPDYIIPKPNDPRLIYTVSPAVARAAMESGIAAEPITDWEAYTERLMGLLGSENKLLRNLAARAKENPKRIVFAEADHPKILKAAQTMREEGLALPILLGNDAAIRAIAEEYSLDIDGMPVLDPRGESAAHLMPEFVEAYYKMRQRKGITQIDASQLMRHRSSFGAMMVEKGYADAMVSGLTKKYAAPIKPALQIIGMEEGVRKVAGMYIVSTRQGRFFFADTTVNVDPTAEDLVDIAILTAKAVKRIGATPRIAMLSYSNFGSSTGETPEKVRRAVEMLHRSYPDLLVDGDLQANFAVNRDLLKEQFPFSTLVDKRVNTLIFPNLASGNIAFKLMQELGGAECTGPILLGMKKPMHVLPLGCSVKEIINLATIAVVEAQAASGG